MAESTTLVSAQPHAMKSLSWLQACLEAVVNGKVWGHFAAPNVKSTLFIETEDPCWLVEARIRGIAAGLGLGSNEDASGFHYACTGPFDFVGSEKYIRDLITKYSPDFVVISTLQSTLSGRSMKEQSDMAPVMAAVIRLSRLAPLVLITHSPWDRKQRRAAGTVTQAANFLTSMHYQKTVDKKSGATYAQVVVDSKAGALETDFYLKLAATSDARDPSSVRSITYGGKGWPKGIGKDAVLAIIADDPDLAPKEIAEQAGVSPRYVQQLIKNHGAKR
jgi:hypothetical protein